MKTFLHIALVFGISACCGGGKKSPPAEASPAVSTKTESSPTMPVVTNRDFKDRPAVTVKAKEILDEYKNNEVRADGKFKGQIVQIHGKVEDVKKDIADDIYVTIGTGAQFEIPVVQCFVKDGEEKAASALNKGDNVTVMGQVDGLMMNVLVKECVINPDMKLCERLRVAFGGEGKCTTNGSNVNFGIPKQFSMEPICMATKKQFDYVAAKMPADDAKAKTLHSDNSLCFLIIAGSALTPEFVAKAQAALDTL
jgi:hypothetical protein